MKSYFRTTCCQRNHNFGLTAFCFPASQMPNGHKKFLCKKKVFVFTNWCWKCQIHNQKMPTRYEMFHVSKKKNQVSIFFVFFLGSCPFFVLLAINPKCRMSDRICWKIQTPIGVLPSFSTRYAYETSCDFLRFGYTTSKKNYDLAVFFFKLLMRKFGQLLILSPFLHRCTTAYTFGGQFYHLGIGHRIFLSKWLFF